MRSLSLSEAPILLETLHKFLKDITSHLVVLLIKIVPKIILKSANGITAAGLPSNTFVANASTWYIFRHELDVAMPFC